MSKRRRRGDPWSNQFKEQQLQKRPDTEAEIRQKYAKMESHIPDFTYEERQTISKAVEDSFSNNTFNWDDFLNFADTMRPGMRNGDWGQPTESEKILGSEAYFWGSIGLSLAMIPLSAGTSMALSGIQSTAEQTALLQQSNNERRSRKVVSPSDQSYMIALYALWKAKGWWVDGKVTQSYYDWVRTTLEKTINEEIKLSAENEKLYMENQRYFDIWRRSLETRTRELEHQVQTQVLNRGNKLYQAGIDTWKSKQELMDQMNSYYRLLGQSSNRELYDLLIKIVQNKDRVWYSKKSGNTQKEFLTEYEKQVKDATTQDERLARSGWEGLFSNSTDWKTNYDFWLKEVDLSKPIWQDALTTDLYIDDMGRIRSSDRALDERILKSLYNERRYDFEYESQLGVLASQNPSQREYYAKLLEESRKRLDSSIEEDLNSLTVDDIRILTNNSYEYKDYSQNIFTDDDGKVLWNVDFHWTGPGAGDGTFMYWDVTTTQSRNNNVNYFEPSNVMNRNAQEEQQLQQQNEEQARAQTTALQNQMDERKRVEALPV